jgi:hypothetical protein
MRVLAVLLLLIGVVVAGCSSDDDHPQNGKFGGLYGGIDSGGAAP